MKEVGKRPEKSPGLRIAVAEDERDTREYLQEVLQRLGHEVVVAASTGRELADKCLSTAPDLIVTDIKMPDMDGIEASNAVSRQKATPAILVSAYHDDELLSRLGGSYIMAYLVKPIMDGELNASIALAMTRFQQFQDLVNETSDLRQALEDRKIIERAKGIIMKRLRVDEEEAFRRLRKLASDHNHRLIEVGRRVITSEEVFQQLERN
jgi:response regulator NasT